MKPVMLYILCAEQTLTYTWAGVAVCVMVLVTGGGGIGGGREESGGG